MLNGPARAPDLGSTKRTKEDFSRIASSRIGPLGADASFLWRSRRKMVAQRSWRKMRKRRSAKRVQVVEVVGCAGTRSDGNG